MQTVFDSVLNMSITASIVILVVVIARFMLKGLPKKYSYALWSIVAFRLCCPFSFKSVISIFNINPIQNPSEVVTNSGSMNYIDAPFYIVNPQPDGVTMNGYVIGGADAPVTTIVEHNFTDVLPYIWFVGVIALLIYGFVNYFITRSKLTIATKKENNIYQSENITSPFILGIIKPKIYVPYSIDEEYYDYVIAHEKHHLKRCDNVIKFVAFLLLCVHWFNPLCWVAFYLMSKDMEMSCDEWVLAHNEGIKKAYSNALLSFAVGKNFPKPSPLCFGEDSAKSRIKNILKFKKPAVIVSVIAFVLCVVIAVVCIANPKSEPTKNNDLITNNVTNTPLNTDINQKVRQDVYNIGKPMYVDLKQSMDLSNVKSIEIKDEKYIISSSNQPDFVGIVANHETMNGSNFFKYWSDLGLQDISPIDTSEFNIIEINYISEEYGTDIEYALYYFDNQLALIGFVNQDEADENIVWAISDIENNSIYKQSIISKGDSIKKAYRLQTEKNNAKYDEIELKKPNESFFAFGTEYNPNKSGHSYYGISFFDTNTTSDYYYYCIDTVTGEVIFESMMGD